MELVGGSRRECPDMAGRGGRGRCQRLHLLLPLQLQHCQVASTGVWKRSRCRLCACVGRRVKIHA